MKWIELTADNRQQVLQQLAKPFFDDIPVSPRIADGLKKLFGEDITPAAAVQRIVNDVKTGGARAVCDWSNRIDGTAFTPDDLAVTADEFDRAYSKVSDEFLQSLRRGIANINAFHEQQKPKSWIRYDHDGIVLGQNSFPLDSAGVYVPGGTAAYPSSVMMTVIPAKVAGVKRVVMVAPPAKDGSLNPHVLVAARECGVDEVYKIGGAQAIAALAYGAGPVPKVDKIAGPGNIFVTLAKKLVYGCVDIDMLAGPSEILIVADATAKPEFVAADLLSQAEHDPLASSILLTDSKDLAHDVQQQLEIQLQQLPRREIAAASLEQNGVIVVTDNIPQAIDLANHYAPEHLELAVAEPFRYLGDIHHAGAVFLGHWSPEPLGDYFAGPNHVLPTGGTAKFYSLLNVETFMKKSSMICYSEQALLQVADDVVRLARTEGLDAHARSIEIRRGRS